MKMQQFKSLIHNPRNLKQRYPLIKVLVLAGSLLSKRKLLLCRKGFMLDQPVKTKVK